MTTYMYHIEISKGFPLLIKTLNELGNNGWCLVGVANTTTLSDSTNEQPYPVEEFWYYFVKEIKCKNTDT